MTLHDYLAVVRRRWWILVATALLTTAGAVGYSLHQQKLYSASSDVQVNTSSGLPGSSGSNPDPTRTMATQVVVARTSTVAKRALRAARVRNQTPEEFLSHSSVSASSTADILTFSVTDPVARRAVTLTNAYANQYVAYRHERDSTALNGLIDNVTRRLDQLQSQGRQNTAAYAGLLLNLEQLQAQQALQSSMASVVRPADTASQVQPRTIRNAAFGFALGLLLGLGLIFLVESLDTRVRSPEELAQQLQLPLLARLPEPPRKLRKQNRLIMIDSPQSPAAEAFRVFATNVEFANLERHAQTFMFTSAAQDEGKSTSIANLAISFALSSRRVVLVDLDLRNPQQHRFFALRQQPGLTEVALGRCELEDALAAVPLFPHEDAPSEADGFDGGKTLEVLPCGALPPSAGEFVRSQALTDILDQLRDRAEFVFIDTPPALGAGDALALSAKVDALIVVSSLGKARRPMLDELHRALQASPVPVLGLAVTGAELEYRYSYGPYSAAPPLIDQRKVKK